MTYSASDFSDEIFRVLHQAGAIHNSEYDDDDLVDNVQLQIQYASDGINRLVEVQKALEHLYDAIGKTQTNAAWPLQDGNAHQAVERAREALAGIEKRVIEADREQRGIKIIDKDGLPPLGFDTNESLPVFDAQADVPIPARKTTVEALAELALNAACLAVQQAVGQDDGGLASMMISESDFDQLFRPYCAAELRHAEDRMQRTLHVEEVDLARLEFIAAHAPGNICAAERLAIAAREARTPQQLFGVAISLSGVYQETGDEDHDCYWFQDDMSSARVNRDTLSVEIIKPAED